MSDLAIFFIAGVSIAIGAAATLGYIPFQNIIAYRRSDVAALSRLLGDDDIITVFLINSDLKMGKGKICAQVGHAALSLWLKNEKNPFLTLWEHQGRRTLAFSGTLQQIRDAEKEGARAGFITTHIRDAGRTQIAPGSMTCVAIGPLPFRTASSLFKNLKPLN